LITAWPDQGKRRGAEIRRETSGRHHGDRSGGGSSEGHFFLQGRVEDDDVNAAISRASFRDVVVVHGMIFGESGGGKAIGLDVIAIDEHADEFSGASGGEFPIGGKVRVMDGNVVRVPFDAEIFRARDDHLGQAIDGLDRGGTHGGRAALIKAHFPEADHEAFLLGLDGTT
jgi:hypothetical protein